MKLWFVLFSLLVVAFTPVSAAPIKITTLTTVLTELAQQVGGDRVEVVGLVQPGVDPHEFQPKPGDLVQVAESQLILASGKHLEGYLAKLKMAAASNADFVPVGDQFPSLKMASEHGDTQMEDPHWWHSIVNMEAATRVVRDVLIKISPDGKEDFARNAETYLGKLAKLRQWEQQKVAELPRDQRRLVTSHDAFQYFARENDFTVYAIEGVSTEDEPTSRKVAEIIDTIKAENVKAIFVESIENPKVTTEITRETGAKIGGAIYADGLGTNEAQTYEAMIKFNVNTIVDALK